VVIQTPILGSSGVKLMKPGERDALLIRLDERSNNMWKIIHEGEDNIWSAIKEIRDHQRDQNGKLDRTLEMACSNRTWINVFKASITVIAGGLISALLTKLKGFW